MSSSITIFNEASLPEHYQPDQIREENLFKLEAAVATFQVASRQTEIKCFRERDDFWNRVGRYIPKTIFTIYKDSNRDDVAAESRNLSEPGSKQAGTRCCKALYVTTTIRKHPVRFSKQ